MGKLFGTDGVRGIANKKLTVELAYNLGRACAHVLGSETHKAPNIIIGMDTRISGDMLESALTAGICSVGGNVTTVGIVPTPTVAYLTKSLNFSAGAVISASHNPFEFNGIKFFNNAGYKLSDELEEKIEDIVLNNSVELPKPLGDKIGKKQYIYDEYIDLYLSHLKKTIDSDLEGLKVVLDCSNGAAYKIAPKLFTNLGADITVINNEPDGININKNCGSTCIDILKDAVIKNKADVGIAFDGDADRALAVDELGNLVDGDQIMAIIGLDLKKKGRLKNNTIVATVMSNLGLDIMGKRENINIAKTIVGDRYVLQEMLEKDYVIGGEQSGHVIFLEHNTTGDGLLTAIQLLKVFKDSKEKLSTLASVVEVLPQVLINAKVKEENKNKYLEDEVVAKCCNEIEQEFDGNGRVLIRPSGTEPLVRVMIEGKDIEYIGERAKELAALIEKRLG